MNKINNLRLDGLKHCPSIKYVILTQNGDLENRYSGLLLVVAKTLKKTVTRVTYFRKQSLTVLSVVRAGIYPEKPKLPLCLLHLLRTCLVHLYKYAVNSSPVMAVEL